MGVDVLPVDPVCGAEVPETVEFKVKYRGVTYYFCCGHCMARFRENPEAYAK